MKAYHSSVLPKPPFLFTVIQSSDTVSNARKIAIYVVREITQMPLASIGVEFGGRDHSTIVYAVNNVSASIKKDSHLKELVEDMIKNIKDRSNA